MSKNRIYLLWAVRIIISGLFILSAVAKMFPLWSFEKQLVDLGLTTWCQSHYLVRLIIALELAIGIAILMKHHLKRIVIPLTIVLLVAFCIHLSIEMIKHGAMNGNCGCFGQLIPMTPLEAFVKNIVTIGLLVFLWFHVKDDETSKFIFPLTIYLASGLALFMLFPFAPCGKEANLNNNVSNNAIVDSSSLFTIDTAFKDLVAIDTIGSVGVGKDKLGDSVVSVSALVDKNKLNVKQKDGGVPLSNSLGVVKKAVVATKVVQSAHSKFYQFNRFGNLDVNMDQGKKIVCMFAPGCDHCKETAKELNALIVAGLCPADLYILFMDEEVNLIPDFFVFAGKSFPYQVLDIPMFWDLIGSNATTPGVFYLNNGVVVKSYQGIESQKFNAEEFKKIVAN